MKKTLISMVFGFILASVPMAIYAACPPTTTIGKGRDAQVCHLISDGGCSGGVCVCYYQC